MQPLPFPVRGGAVQSLAPFLNRASENDFVLVVAWLLGALRRAAPIRSWPSPANKDQRRPSGAPDPNAPPCMRQRFLPWTDGDLQGLPGGVAAFSCVAFSCPFSRVPTIAWPPSATSRLEEQSSRTRPSLRRDHPGMSNGASLVRDESSPHGNRSGAQGAIADTAMTGA
jgi:hypothetical protein